MRGERGEAERSHHDADKHEADHRADPQAVKQRDDDASGAEDDQGFFIDGGGFHPVGLAGPL